MNRRPERGWGSFVAVWIVQCVVLLPLALAWWVSPLAVGFHDWPAGTRGEVGRILYIVGFCTNAAMILAWAGSPLLAAIRGPRFALVTVFALAAVQIAIGALMLFVFRD